MNKYQIGELVYKGNEIKEIINVIHTNLGVVYDTQKLGSDEIEVCFEYSLEKLGK